MGKRTDAKQQALREQGSLNGRSKLVADPLFLGSEFFDPRDLVQVKYEMLRRVRTDKHSVAAAAKAFGLSRPSFYQAQNAFEKGGLPGLARKRPGPRSAHKLSAEVLRFIDRARARTHRCGAAAWPASCKRSSTLRCIPAASNAHLNGRKKRGASRPPSTAIRSTDRTVVPLDAAVRGGAPPSDGGPRRRRLGTGPGNAPGNDGMDACMAGGRRTTTAYRNHNTPFPSLRLVRPDHVGHGRHDPLSPTTGDLRMNSENHQKVAADHLRRNAYLYVRQSTLRQVLENTESTQRQYALRQRAVALGWPIGTRDRHRQ